MNESVRAGMAGGAPTDTSLEPAPSTQQYSLINEKPGGGFQRVPTDAAL